MLSSATQHSLSWLMQAVVATTPWDTRGTVPAQHKVRGITSVLAQTALRSQISESFANYESMRHYVRSVLLDFEY